MINKSKDIITDTRFEGFLFANFSLNIFLKKITDIPINSKLLESFLIFSLILFIIYSETELLIITFKLFSSNFEAM